MILFPHPSNAEIEQCVALTHKAITERLVSLGFIDGDTPSQQRQSDPLAKRKKRGSEAKEAANIRPPVADMTIPQHKLSKEERSEWDIPLCVSNYVNPKGHIVPLEIRAMAAKAKSAVPSDKHGAMSEYASKVSVEAHAQIAALEREEEEKIAMEIAMEEERLRELARMNEESRKSLLREMEKSETREERSERRQREAQLQEHRRQIHRQELRKDRLRERLGIEDVSLERDIADAVALGPDLPGEDEAGADVFFDERLTKITSGEVDDTEVSKSAYLQSKNTEYTLNRRDIAGEVERMFSGADGNASELVFENDDEEDPFAALDAHLERNA